MIKMKEEKKRAARRKNKKESLTGMARNKKFFIIFSLSAFLLFAAIYGSILLTGNNNNPGKFDTVFLVDGEPVVYKEFKHYLDAGVDGIYTYFKNKFGVEDSKDFWTTAYGGEVPVEMLKKLAVEKAVYDKVQQIKAKEHGIVKSISYRQMLVDMKIYNETRSDKVKKNQVIYGPVEVDEKAYIAAMMFNLSRDLKDKLKADFEFTDKDYADMYEKNRGKYNLGTSRKVKTIAAVFKDDQEKKSKSGLAEEKLESIKKRLDTGTKFEDIYNEIQKSNNDIITASEQTFNSSQIPRTAGIDKPTLLEEIFKMKMEEVKGIIDDKMSVGIYKLVEETVLGNSTLEDAKSGIKLDLIDVRYSELVEQWVEEASIDIIQKNMSRLKIK